MTLYNKENFENIVMMKWNDVNKELPITSHDKDFYSVPVIVADKVDNKIYKELFIYDYRLREWIFYSRPSVKNFNNITHWVYLPELPK